MESERAHQRRLRRAIRRALTELGRRFVAGTRDMISVDVERIGSEVIRSEPGEPPRRETWKLWKSIKYKVEAHAETVEDLLLYTTDPKAPLLENGTHFMEPRPFWGRSLKAMGNMNATLKRLIVQYMRETDPSGDSPADTPPAADENS